MPGYAAIILTVACCALCTVGLEIKPELKVYNDLISLVPDGIMDVKIKDSLKDIVKFADKIFSRVDKPSVHPLPVNLGLLRLFALSNNLAPLPATELDESNFPAIDYSHPPAHMSEELIAEAFHFFGYANEAYSSNPRIVQQDLLLNNLADKDSSNIKLPRHVVFLDHLTKSIVVSVRGTASVSDMITDLYIEPYPFLEPARNLYAHHGMAESAEALLTLVTAAITEIRSRVTSSRDGNSKKSKTKMPWDWGKSSKKYKYADYRVVVTGHSLGAGTASLLAILLCMKSNISATAFAYAPPPALSSVSPIPYAPATKRKFYVPFPKFGRKNNPEPYYKIHAFVHNNDIISRSSHTQILSMISALSAVDEMPWGALDRSSILLRNSLTTEEAELMRARLRSRRRFTDGNDRDLYIPGDIYLLRPVVLSADSSVTVDRGLEAKNMESAADQRNCSTATSNGNSSSREAPAPQDKQQDKQQEFSFNIFGKSLPAPPVPPQIGDAVRNMTTNAQNAAAQGVTYVKNAASQGAINAKNIASQGIDSAKSAVGDKVQQAQEQGRLPKSPVGNITSPSSYYHALCVKDPRALFNGLMYYGDAMVYDHLTVPFERALLQLMTTRTV